MVSLSIAVLTELRGNEKVGTGSLSQEPVSSEGVSNQQLEDPRLPSYQEGFLPCMVPIGAIVYEGRTSSDSGGRVS